MLALITFAAFQDLPTGLLFGLAVLLVIAMHYAANVAGFLINRAARVAMVATRGWPPVHLDADGDHKRDCRSRPDGGDNGDGV